METAENVKYLVLGLEGLFGVLCLLVFLLFCTRGDDFLLWRQKVQADFILPTSLALVSILLNPPEKKEGEARPVVLC